MRIIANKIPSDMQILRMVKAMQQNPVNFPIDFKEDISYLMRMGYPDVFPAMVKQYGKKLAMVFFTQLDKQRAKWKHTPMLKEMIDEIDRIKPHYPLDIKGSSPIKWDNSKGIGYSEVTKNIKQLGFIMYMKPSQFLK